jgi:hypothetical protein
MPNAPALPFAAFWKHSVSVCSGPAANNLFVFYFHRLTSRLSRNPLFSQPSALPVVERTYPSSQTFWVTASSQVSISQALAASLGSLCSKLHCCFLCFQQLTHSFLPSTGVPPHAAEEVEDL